MANIAFVRDFNGSSDYITLDDVDYDNIAMGATTFAAIVKTDTDSGFHWVLSAAGGFGGKWSLGQNGTAVSLFFNPNTSNSAASIFTTAMGWCLIAVTRAGGASTPRFHRYRYDTGNWSHADGGGSLAETGVLDNSTLRIGSYDGTTEFWDGKIACIGAWYATALSDSQLQELTTAFSSWQALSPTGLWLLNQSSTGSSVLDQVGHGHQTALNGTTVAAESTLAFDVGGGVVSSNRSLLLGVG
jgi:hypothetical protein